MLHARTPARLTLLVVDSVLYAAASLREAFIRLWIRTATTDDCASSTQADPNDHDYSRLHYPTQLKDVCRQRVGWWRRLVVLERRAGHRRVAWCGTYGHTRCACPSRQHRVRQGTAVATALEELKEARGVGEIGKGDSATATVEAHRGALDGDVGGLGGRVADRHRLLNAGAVVACV